MPPDGMDATAGIESVAAGAAPAMLAAVALDRDLRSASVTIRLSKAESAKLHQRAGESGLTVSAYLRACALEAETLRAQVKQALAELKAGNEGTRERGSRKTGVAERKSRIAAGTAQFFVLTFAPLIAILTYETRPGRFSRSLVPCLPAIPAATSPPERWRDTA